MLVCICVGKIFSKGGALVDFSKSFSSEDKSGEICFLPLELRKQNFWWNFQSPTALPTRPVTSLGH